MKKRAILKPGREKSLLNRHPWIFSGAIASLPEFEQGEILEVYSSSGQYLAQAYFHKENSLAARVLTFDCDSEDVLLDKRLDRAIALRTYAFCQKTTNCFRLVHAEADELPGLIIDIYNSIAVMQINTWGMQRLKEKILSLLLKKLPHITGVLEKSVSSACLQEGLEEKKAILFGEVPQELIVKEHGLCMYVTPEKGQKTGLFLDQREMRQLIFRHARGKRVLNCFSYTGGFSLFALSAGAKHVTSIDVSKKACDLAYENTLLNQFPIETHTIIQADVFAYLRQEELPFDLVILDPPAFAKRRQDIHNACFGYKEINRLSLAKMPYDSLLLSSSCSYFVNEILFRQLLFQAAADVKRSVSILSKHIQTPDHPVSLFHPEGDYLKSFFLRVC
ncbi:MAG: class I SAM-dependent rRNA methyltransferase [Chlamydiales bacterium]|jgi:23S rRNA (cytosine1962-C5)-methyltransferase|nr:class I SAM-dependent rRNA methyltransferase [Chlamydiales bacterium]